MLFFFLSTLHSMFFIKVHALTLPKTKKNLGWRISERQKRCSELEKKQRKNKKKTGCYYYNTCFRGSTGGFCVLDFWPFSSFFSNKDVTRFFFLKQEKLTTLTELLFFSKHKSHECQMTSFRKFFFLKFKKWVNLLLFQGKFGNNS